MSKLEKGDNPCPHVSDIISDEKGKVMIPPEKYTITVSPSDVESNSMKLTTAENFSFKEIDGKIYRIGKSGIEYPPISREEFDRIKKSRKTHKIKEQEIGE